MKGKLELKTTQNHLFYYKFVYPKPFWTFIFLQNVLDTHFFGLRIFFAKHFLYIRFFMVIFFDTKFDSSSTITRLKSKVFSLERLYKFYVKKNFNKNFGCKKILALKKIFKQNSSPKKNFGLKKNVGSAKSFQKKI